MTFRGYFALNQVEIANSSRVVAHLGRGVPQDKARAAQLYRRAAEQGDAWAACNLAL